MKTYIYIVLFLFASFLVGPLASAQTTTWPPEVLESLARSQQHTLEQLQRAGGASGLRSLRSRMNAACTLGDTHPSDTDPCPALTDVQRRLESGEIVTSDDLAPFSALAEAACHVDDPTDEESVPGACPRLDRLEERVDTLWAVTGDHTNLIDGLVADVEALEERTNGVGLGGELAGFFDGDDFTGFLASFEALFPIGSENWWLALTPLVGGNLQNDFLWGFRVGLMDELENGNRLGPFAGGYFLRAEDDRNIAVVGLEYGIPVSDTVELQLHGGLGYETAHGNTTGVVSGGLSYRPSF